MCVIDHLKLSRWKVFKQSCTMTDTRTCQEKVIQESEKREDMHDVKVESY